MDTINRMEYRINEEKLLDIISIWNGFLKRKVHLIACGGTALTLLNVKDTTKDIDFIVPEIKEYEYLVKLLIQIGYKYSSGTGLSAEDGFVFDLFPGKKVHTTELLESPLKQGNNFLIKEFSHIYLGVINYYDLIISKLFRGTTVDFEDCLSLVRSKRKQISIEKLQKRFKETASYDITEEKDNKHFAHFIYLLKKKD